jgi:hypothetical protein
MNSYNQLKNNTMSKTKKKATKVAAKKTPAKKAAKKAVKKSPAKKTAAKKVAPKKAVKAPAKKAAPKKVAKASVKKAAPKKAVVVKKPTAKKAKTADVKDVKVKLHEYKGILVIETVNPQKKHSDFIPSGDGRFGCVLAKCDPTTLGISKEAFALLSKVKRGRDSLGDLDIFKANDNQVVFGWIGGVFALQDPKQSTGSREYDPSLLTGKYKEIANEAPKGAKEAIDSSK